MPSSVLCPPLPRRPDSGSWPILPAKVSRLKSRLIHPGAKPDHQPPLPSPTPSHIALVSSSSGRSAHSTLRIRRLPGSPEALNQSAAPLYKHLNRPPSSLTPLSLLSLMAPVAFVAPEVPLPGPAHVTEADAIVKALDSNVRLGLSATQASELQTKYGPNQIKPPAKPSPWKLLGRQIANAMTIVLLASMAVSFGTQDWIEAGVIAALVILNVSVGFTQEWKAEKTVAALASVGSPTATVIRHQAGASKGGDGQTTTIQVEEVVPGDIIMLTNGDVVPADARVLPGHSSSLECDEALLTGESLPAAKKPDVLDDADCPVGDKKNMVFAGSQVAKGRARCIVVATGMGTELGKIAEAMERTETVKETGWRAKWYKTKVVLGVAGTTPLQTKLNKLAYILLGMALLLAFIVVASTAFVDVPMSIATYAVATAVSILPASLIAVVSLTLATASRELARKNALVRRMDAVESLSVVTDICSDKTGTITVGKMVVKKAWIPVNTAFPTDGHKVEIDLVRGQAYSAESGSDPFYPRGTIRALPRTRVPGRSATTDTSGTTLSNDDLSDDDESDDDLDSEDVIRPSEMEEGFKNLTLCASLNNMSTIHRGDNEDRWEAAGDATEIALQVFAHKLGHGKPHLTHPKKASKHHGDPKTNPLSPVQSRVSDHGANPIAKTKIQMDGHYEIVVEHPFDSTVKRMTTVWRHDNPQAAEQADLLVFMKGAVERILDRCLFIGLNPDSRVKLDDAGRAHIIARMDTLAAEGLRVLALSAKLEPRSSEEQLKTLPRDEVEQGFCFLGLVGIYDPPRPQSRGAVLESQQAGLTVRMLTGDHPATAEAISISVGILRPDAPKGSVMTGTQFDALSEEEIDALPSLPLVVARCAPETKVRMVEAIHRRKIEGMRCSSVMTGDGVNDCPALKRADIGFAMGQNGSDVAKGAADIVLADDNFATITRAIKKGRGVLMNLQKFLLFLLTGNIAEVLVLVVGLAFKDSDGYSVYPLSPVTALFINTIAAGPPALALGLEPTASDAMIKGPTAFRTIFTLWWWMDLFFYGFLMGGLTIVNFVIVVWGTTMHGGKGDLGAECNEGSYDSRCENVFRGRGTAFATLTLMIMLHAFECKHLERGIFQMNLLDNKILLWSSGICALVVFPILYIPVISDYVFQLLGLGWEWGIVVASLIVYLAATELWKLVRRINSKNKDKGGPVMTEKNLPRFDTIAEREKGV